MKYETEEEKANHREHSRWLMWRCLIDHETAEFIMHDQEMRGMIAAFRAGEKVKVVKHRGQ